MTARRALPRYGFTLEDYELTHVVVSLKRYILSFLAVLYVENIRLQCSFCSKARNLAVYVEFRHSDEEGAKPLKVVYRYILMLPWKALLYLIW